MVNRFYGQFLLDITVDHIQICSVLILSSAMDSWYYAATVYHYSWMLKLT